MFFNIFLFLNADLFNYSLRKITKQNYWKNLKHIFKRLIVKEKVYEVILVSVSFLKTQFPVRDLGTIIISLMYVALFGKRKL